MKSNFCFLILGIFPFFLCISANDTTIIPLYPLHDTEADPVGCIEIDSQNTTKSCTTSAPMYRLVLPTTPGQAGQVLGLLDSSGDLTWLSTSTTVAEFSSCDIPLTLILRDTTGSFVATTITLTGASLINVPTLYGDECDGGQGFIWSSDDILHNTLIGIGAGTSNNPDNRGRNVAIGYDALASNTRGGGNVAVGFQALLNYPGDDNGGNIAIGGTALLNYNPDALRAQINPNTAVGNGALAQLINGTFNIAIGGKSGSEYAGSESNNIVIGTRAIAGDENVTRLGYFGDNSPYNDQQLTTSCFIAGIYNTNISAGHIVSVDEFGQLGYDPNSTNPTTCDTPNTPVLRDTTGSFVATTITLTGASLINVPTLYGDECDGGQGFIWSSDDILQNTLIGIGAGTSNNPDNGGNNVAIGYDALASNTRGINNIAIGSQALLNYPGDDRGGNIAIGNIALLNYNPDALRAPPFNPNTAVGTSALVNLINGTFNIAIGGGSGSKYAGSESNNIVIGTNAVAGDENVTRLGYFGNNPPYSDQQLTTSCFIAGIYNTGIFAGHIVSVDEFGQLGYDPNSILANATPCATPNTLVLRDRSGSFVATTITLTGASLINVPTLYGDECDGGQGFIWSSDDILQNTLIGIGAGTSNNPDNGGNNVAIGYDALASNTGGFLNVAVGYEALASTTGGKGNVAVGAYALQLSIGIPATRKSLPGAPLGNTAIGHNSLGQIVEGVSNIAIGASSGYAYNGNETANIIIGTSAIVGDNNITRIGYFSDIDQNDALTTQSCFIAGIYDNPVNGKFVTVNSDGQLGFDVIPTVTLLTNSTPCDTPNTLVLRDIRGSFVATTITLTGASLINVPTLYGDECDGGQGFIWSSDDILQNTLIGIRAGTSNNPNNRGGNVAIGYDALASNRGGGNNLAVGFQALFNYPGADGGGNTAIGTNALLNYRSLDGLSSPNTAVGDGALANLINGTFNIAIGGGSGSEYADSESNNIVIGTSAVAGDENVIRLGYFGDSSPYNDQQLTTSCFIAGIYNNPIVGQFVTVNSDGQLGFDVIPTSTLLTNPTPCDTPNTLVLRDGSGSFVATTITLSGNSLINYSDGRDVCYSGSGFVWAPTQQNTIIGLNAGNSNIFTGSNNIALGFEALMTLTDGFNNIAIGSQAMSNISNTQGIPMHDTIAIGYQALQNNNSSNSNHFPTGNLAIGSYALNQNTNGDSNIAIGLYSMKNNDSSSQNVAIGGYSLESATTGGQNIAIGNGALYSASNPSGNSVIGVEALINATGSVHNNVALGYRAGYNTQGSNNTLLGFFAGSDLGDGNIVIGSGAGSSFFSSESNNIILGTVAVTGDQSTTRIGFWTDNADLVDTTSCFIAGIYNHPIVGQFVTVNSDGQLGFDEIPTSTLLTHATSCDVPLTLVQRDSAGSFASTTITLTGASIINVMSNGPCNEGQGFIWNSEVTHLNTLIGLNAGTSNIGGFANVAVGFDALSSNTFGMYNVGIGTGALSENAQGNRNTAIGTQALISNVTGDDNTALGYSALYYNTADANTGLGSKALFANVSGAGNVALGNQALFATLSGNDNIAIGNHVAQNYTSAESNNIVLGTTAIAGDSHVTRIGLWTAQDGVQTQSCFIAGIYDQPIAGQFVTINSDGQLGFDVIPTSTLLTHATSCDVPLTLIQRDNAGSFASTTITLTGNSLINYSSLGACDTGSGFVWAPTNQNTIIGLGAGNNNILTGQQNTALGNNALHANTTGTANVALGALSLAGNISGNHNTAVGEEALAANTTNSDSTALGYRALQNNLGSQNIAMGSQALQNNTAGSNNVALGYQAMQNSTCANTVAIGYHALQNDANQFNNNTAVGYNALSNNTTGPNNTALGYNALANPGDGIANTGLGYQVLQNLGSSYYSNTGVGASALSSLTSGVQNTALGNAALGNYTSGSDSVALGYNTLSGLGPFDRNTAVGSQAGTLVSTGSGNVILGFNAAPALTTGSNNIIIGTNAATAIGGNTFNTGNNCIIIGAFENIGNADGKIHIGNPASGVGVSYTSCHIGGIFGVTASGGSAVYVNSGGQLGTATSSARYKENIHDLATTSEIIYKLRPVEFNYINDPEKWFEAGLIAEEVEEVMPELVVYKDGQPETVRYQHLPILMLNEQQKHNKAILELQSQNAQLHTAIKSLQERNAQLEYALYNFVSRVETLEKR